MLGTTRRVKNDIWLYQFIKFDDLDNHENKVTRKTKKYTYTSVDNMLQNKSVSGIQRIIRCNLSQRKNKIMFLNLLYVVVKKRYTMNNLKNK